jgi:hypothetical protein
MSSCYKKCSSVRHYHTLLNSLLEDDTIDRVSGCHVLNKLSNKSSKLIDGLIISILRPRNGGSKISLNSSYIMIFYIDNGKQEFS